MSPKRPLQDLIQNLWFGSREKDAIPIPLAGPQRIWFVIRTHYIGMILLNLLFIFLCIPVITIPGALSGMTKIIMKWTRDELVDFMPDFFTEFKTDFVKRLLVWLVMTLAPISFSLYPYMLGMGREGTIVLLVLLCSLSFLIQSYLFPVFVLIEIPVGTALKNSFLLIFLEWRCSIKILLTSGLIYALCFIFTLYTIPLLVLFLISLNQLITCVLVNEKIGGRLILPDKG